MMPPDEGFAQEPSSKGVEERDESLDAARAPVGRALDGITPSGRTRSIAVIHDTIPNGWLALGLVGQAMFSGRFLVQWIASERKRASVIPKAFWWLSLTGGVVLLAYAIHRRDPVFILGQSAGLLVYGRNLALLRGAGTLDGA